MESAEETQTDVETRRERSTISFPYGDLEDAVTVATGLHDTYGGRASQDQVAAALGTTVKSGAFRLRMATARVFGVIEGRGEVSLTELGRRIVDPATQAQARADAFLRVPLYSAIFEENRGATLPGDRGLEARMKELGVSEKQVGKARQAFQRSAEQAGFFAQGKTRLVQPPTTASATTPKPEGTKMRKPPAGDFDQDPLLVGLFLKLPPPGTRWSKAEQERWQELAKVIIPAVYGSDE